MDTVALNLLSKMFNLHQQAAFISNLLIKKVSVNGILDTCTSIHTWFLYFFFILFILICIIQQYLPRAVPGKKVLGGGTELKNGGTTNTILSFFMVQFIWIFQETPPPT